MLGEKLGQESGNITSRRVLESDGPPAVEISFESAGSILGVNHRTIGTYKSVLRPDGTVFGEGQGVVMGAGGGMPLHTNAVEHEQYVLKGRAAVRIGDSSHDVAAGTALLIPAGVPHSYKVLEAPFEFLCIVPNQHDCITLVDQ